MYIFGIDIHREFYNETVCDMCVTLLLVEVCHNVSGVPGLLLLLF